MPKEIKERFAKMFIGKRTELGLSQEEIADAIGTVQQTVWKWENAKTFPRSRLWAKIRDEVGIDPGKLVKPEKGFELLSDDNKPEFYTLPKYKSRLSGGPGELKKEDMVETVLAFRAKWIDAIGDVDDLALFEVTGTSMSPTINDGDVVMVNRSFNTTEKINPGMIYAFCHNHLVHIKRLIFHAGEIFAVSDNKTVFPDYKIDKDNFTLIGQVVWSGHEHTKH